MSRVPIHDHTNISQGGKIRASTSITGADLTGSDLGGGGGTSSVDDHLMNPTDAHDASAVSVLDVANNWTATDVEGILQEIPKRTTTTTDPTTGDDSADGYSIGSRWINTSTDEEFVATDVTVGAALWVSTTDQGSGSGSVATDAIWDAKGDLAVGTGADTAAKLTVGSNDTILMADSGQTTGIKWVASQTPSTQAFSDAAAEGTADTYARGDHKHGMPANPGGGGALVLLEQHTASSSATLDFTTFISSTYDDYLIELVNVIPANNNINFVIRVGTGGGPTYDSGANYGWFERSMRVGGGDVSSGAVSGATSMQIAGVSVGVSNNTLWGVSGNVHLTSPQSTSLNKTFYGQTRWFYDAGADPVMSTCHGTYISTTALTALRFLFGTGNIASGTIRIYGVAK